MNAKSFYLCFLNELAQSRLAKSVYERGGAAFTEHMLRVVEGVIKREFDCKTEREYYRIDVIGWKDRKDEIVAEAKRLHLNPHLWDLRIAVEHENNPLDWTDELIKLAHINCPLRVIIGYTPCDQRGDDMKKLSVAAAWLSRTPGFKLSEKDEFLLILGNSSAADRSVEYESFDYRGYILGAGSNQFIEIV